MSEIKKTIFLFGLIAMLLNCYTVNVNLGEVGLLRDGSSGLIQKTPLAEGKYILVRDDIIVYSLQSKPYQERLEVLTRDDLTINAIATIRVKPISSKIYELHREVGQNYYNNVVREEFRAALKNVFKEYPYAQVTKNFEVMEETIMKVILPKLVAKYIEIESVNIDDVNTPSEISDAIQKKVKKSQEAAAMEYELSIEKKKNEIERLNAQREAEITLIRARAEAEALKLVNSQITTKYIQLKAMENPNNKVIYLPIGRDGLPMLLNLDNEKPGPIPQSNFQTSKTNSKSKTNPKKNEENNETTESETEKN